MADGIITIIMAAGAVIGITATGTIITTARVITITIAPVITIIIDGVPAENC